MRWSQHLKRKTMKKFLLSLIVAALVISLCSFLPLGRNAILPSSKISGTEASNQTLSKLQNGDSLIIDFYSQGCFHSYSRKIVIVKQQAILKAWLYDAKPSKEINFNAKLIITKTATLNDKQIADYEIFEKELQLQNDGGCTTVDTYHIKSKYFSTKKMDGSCEWRGFYKLAESFFKP